MLSPVNAKGFPMQEDWSTPLSPDLKTWHFLSRTTFGPLPAEVERVKQAGIASFLDEQLHPERIDDSAVEKRLAALPTLAMTPAELMEDFPAPKQQAKAQALRAMREDINSNPPASPPGQAMADDRPRTILMELAREQFWRAAYSDRQLQEVMVHFWMNHFNIFAAKGVERWLLTSFEQEAIRPHALGSFQDLLIATAKSPAMLFYLDNWLSVSPDAPAAGPGMGGARGPFALGGANPVAQPARPPAQVERRGLNENYARELMELHTLGVDGGYTQHDVHEVARCFTGWTIDRPRQGGGFLFRPRLHDDGEKVVLGRTIRAHGGIEDGMAVLELLAAHPSTAHFISLKLCRHLVADTPPASVVVRTATTYTATHGDICAVLNSILTSPEFNSQAAFRAKVKSPFELVVSAVRTAGGESDGGPPLLGSIARMGQPAFLYQAPSGFPERASSWINSGTLLARMNFAMALAANRIRGTQVDLQTLAGPADDPRIILEHLEQRALGGYVSRETHAAVLESLDGLNGVAATAPQATAIAALLLGSPEFQRR
jgi:uncharacterized protein (DUF1800 family)